MQNYLVLTGGSRGIGEKTIAHFLREGWQAINIARNPCQQPGTVNISCDLGNADNVLMIADALRQHLIDPKSICLVHNAGFYKRDSVQNINLMDLRQTLEINLVTSAALNNVLIPLMPPTSSIIYIGSTLSEKAVPNSASYVISKHATIGFMRATCQDLNGKHIHTACVCPGLVNTQMLHETMPADVKEMLIRNKVIGGRLIEPEEIAKVVYFCAIEPVINGTVIHANLGQVAD